MSNDWQSSLDDFFNEQEKEAEKSKEKADLIKNEAEEYFRTVARPAFDKIAAELEKHGRSVRVHNSSTSASIKVDYEGRTEFDFTLKSSGGRIVTTESYFLSEGKRYRSEGTVRMGSGDTFENITEEVIIEQTLERYKDAVKYKR